MAECGVVLKLTIKAEGDQGESLLSSQATARELHTGKLKESSKGKARAAPNTQLRAFSALRTLASCPQTLHQTVSSHVTAFSMSTS